MKTFRINFENVHNALLRNIDGKDFLVLEIPSLNGRKRVWLQDGDEVEATDKVMEMALESYECPKFPITRVSKDQKLKHEKKAEKLMKKNKEVPDLVPQQMFYDVADVRGKKPFEEVKK